MRTVTPDRRILKAFYTQYVAVLLIVLVFVVSGFQGNDQLTRLAPIQGVQAWDVSIGAVSIRMPDDVAEGFSNQMSAELDAVAEFVRNHDVLATFRIPIAIERDLSASEVVQQSLTRASQFRDYILKHGVPAQAVRTVLFEGPQAATVVSITFSSMEESHGRE
jgi:hypothetical protein